MLAQRSSYQRAIPTRSSQIRIQNPYSSGISEDRIFILKYGIPKEKTKYAPKPPKQIVQETDKHSRSLLDGLQRIESRWELTENQTRYLLGLQTDRVRYYFIRNGLERLGRDEQDRVIELIGIATGLIGLFGENVELEKKWLESPNSYLDNKSPLDFILQGSVRNILVVSDLLLQIRGL